MNIKRRFLLGVLLVPVLAMVGGLVRPVGLFAAEGPAKGTVTLTIDFQNGTVRTFADLGCDEKTTVLSLLVDASRAAEAKDAKERLSVKYRGKGETAMVTEIGEVKNEGGSGSNWLFKVNETWGDRSAALIRPKGGDKVLWTFGKEK